MSLEKIKVPDLGGFDKVPVIEVLVQMGDRVEKEQSLITLESEKATMDIPAPVSGVVKEIHVKEGDIVSEGIVIAEMSSSEVKSEPETNDDSVDTETRTQSIEEVPATAGEIQSALVVLGGGPGGYSAAFRAADLGLDVLLIEKHQQLGGVCLNVGCIPSKALLHTAEIIREAEAMAQHGVKFGKPEVDIDVLRDWKSSVVSTLNKGLAGMAKQRKVKRLQGTARLSSAHTLEVVSAEQGTTQVRFEKLIVAAGSRVVELPGLKYTGEQIIDSTGALELTDVPKKLLVIGGGIIGLEMATVYSALGSQVTVIELSEQLIPGADRDLVQPLQKRLKQQGVKIALASKVAEIKQQKNGIKTSFEGKNPPETQLFNRILVAVGRKPNGDQLNLEKAGVEVDERGFIPVDQQQRTNVAHIFAIGDICGQPMLAHKASHEAHVAAEVVAGEKSQFDARVIPSVAYTDPEIAWVGVTETLAKQQNLDYAVASFPWAASGRALGLARTEGKTKLITDKNTGRVIGAGIVGVHAGELIAELALAIEMGCDAADIALTIHPHPSLSESVGMGAEMLEGTITDLYIPKR
ncbi:MAG: dihydrolipoyl dehydrogenase [bacterium]